MIDFMSCALAIRLAPVLLLCSCGVSPTAPSTVSTSQETGSVNRPDTPKDEARETGGGGRHRQRHRGQASQRNSGADAGKFDFYVLSLSWSPGFCVTAAGRNDPLQCGADRHFAFVLHGLWPQYEQGGWPHNCSTEVADENLVNGMLNIMPSPKLVAHEWETHGTCSGLSPEDYFGEAREAFNSVKIPSRYQAPQQQITVSPDQLRHDFATVNPDLGDQGLVVLCSGNGRYLQEVRACLTEDLKGRRCNGEVLREACRSDQVIMRPMR